MIKKYYEKNYLLWYFIKIGVLAFIIGLISLKYFFGMLILFIILIFIYHYIFDNLYPEQISKPLFKKIFLPLFNPKMNAFVIGFDENHLVFKSFKINFKKIKTFHPSLGGSEPYILIDDNSKFDIKSSWLTKEDSQEVEKILLKKINER